MPKADEGAGAYGDEGSQIRSTSHARRTLTRGEGRSIDSAARFLNRVPFAPAIAGEKVPKADEGAGACATPVQDDGVRNYSSGDLVAIRVRIIAPNASKLRSFSFVPSRLRSETVWFATSRSPRTSMYGVFLS